MYNLAAIAPFSQLLAVLEDQTLNDLEHLQQITHTSDPKHTFSHLPITTFMLLVMVATADYENPTTKDRVEG